MTDERKGILFAALKDRSFQAFKDFIAETATALFDATGGTPSTEPDDDFVVPDEELMKDWTEYWRKVDENAK